MNVEEPFLQVRSLSKKFGSITALDDISMEAFQGEILAIVGDNGAGKSTLIKILSGVMRPDSGRILIGGREYGFLSPRKAMSAGISTVYQDLGLAGYRDVAANIFLGRELVRGCFLDDEKMYVEAARIIGELGIDIPDVRMPVSVLSGGQRQCTAVARAVHRGGRMFIFDEPTAAMGISETAIVQKLILKLVEDGFGAVIISHNLHQVFEIADRILVMRHGRTSGTLARSDADVDMVVSMITGEYASDDA